MNVTVRNAYTKESEQFQGSPEEVEKAILARYRWAGRFGGKPVKGLQAILERIEQCSPFFVQVHTGAPAPSSPGGGDLGKAVAGPNLGSEAGRQHLNLPAGSQHNGKIKVTHADGTTSWVGVRSGMVLGDDGHAVSARNPSAK